jgi:hypothetical protein
MGCYINGTVQIQWWKGQRCSLKDWSFSTSWQVAAQDSVDIHISYMYMTCSVHYILLSLLTLTLQSEQHRLWSSSWKCSTPSIWVFPSSQWQTKSHPSQNKGKPWFYILIFTFLDRIWEQKLFSTERKQAFSKCYSSEFHNGHHFNLTFIILASHNCQLRWWFNSLQLT